MYGALEKISRVGLCPSTAVKNSSEALKVIEEADRASLNAVEFDFSSPDLNSVKSIVAGKGDLAVGFTRIRNFRDLEIVMEAGADFITVDCPDFIVDEGISVIYSISNEEDAKRAVERGVSALEVNVDIIAKSIVYNAVKKYPEARFILKGSIKNIEEYFGLSDNISYKVVYGGENEAVSDNFERDVYRTLGFELAHVGINESDEESSLRAASRFSEIFGLKTKEEVPSYFSGRMLEVMKFKGRGTNGHIAVGTYSIEKSIEYFKRYGVEFDEKSFAVEDGVIIRAYIVEEIGGFAVHLIKR